MLGAFGAVKVANADDSFDIMADKRDSYENGINERI